MSEAFSVFTKKRIFEKRAIYVPANLNSYRIGRRFSTHIIESGIFHVKRTIARHEKHQGRHTAQRKFSSTLSFLPVSSSSLYKRYCVHCSFFYCDRSLIDSRFASWVARKSVVSKWWEGHACSGRSCRRH